MSKIKKENGYLIYSLGTTEIVIENIKVWEQRKGTGREMIEELKDIARDFRLPIELYSYSLDDTITQNDLNEFYYACGFSLNPDDCDNKLFIWTP